jgi:hypothetical protein
LLRRVLHQPLLLLRRQRLQRPKRRCPLRLGVVDIASILGAPTVMVVRSSL